MERSGIGGRTDTINPYQMDRAHALTLNIKLFLLCCILGSGYSNLFGQGYNLKLGPMAFNLTGQVGLTYDDNIASVENNPASDFILQGGLSFQGNWEITQINELNFSIGASYKKYFEHPELDSSNTFLSIDPDTEISLEAYLGPVTLTVSDAISFSSDPAGVRTPDSDEEEPILKFSRWHNRFSIQALWEMNALTALEADYSRIDQIPLEDEFSFLRRGTHSLSAQLTRILGPDLSSGVWARVQQTDYSGDVQNDSTGYSLGFLLNWQISDFTSLTLQPGWLFRDFDRGGSNTDQSDFAGYTFTAILSNTPSSVYSHSLSYNRSLDYGFVSNYQLQQRLDYQFVYAGFREFEIAGGLSLEHSEDSGGLRPETFHRWIFRLGTSYNLTPQSSLRLNYQHIRKDSDLEGRSYRRNLVSVFFFYDF